MLFTGSRPTHAHAHFSLSDLDIKMSSGQLLVKKEKVASSLASKKSHINLPMKTLGSRKRKIVEDMDFCLKNLGPEEALRKLVSFSQDVYVL